MIKIILFLLILILFPVLSHSAEVRVIPSTDLTYQGSFKLPTPPSGYKWYMQDSAGYYHGGMSFYPTNNSLLVMGGPGAVITQRPWVGEITIPVLKDSTSTAYASLNDGTLVNNTFYDLMGVDGSESSVYLGSIHYYEKHGSQTTDKIYLSARGAYTSPNVYTLLGGHFAWTETDLTALDRHGWWKSGPVVEATGKYIFHAPDGAFDGTAAEGRTLLVGWYRGGGGIYWGPTIYAIAPWLACGGTPINCDTDPPTASSTLPYSTLLQYTTTVTDYANMANTTSMSMNDKFSDAAWVTVGTKRAVIFSGFKNGRSVTEYGYPNAPPFISTPNEGYHDKPGYPCLFLYDPADIIAVAAGTKNANEPQPYRIINLERYFYYKSGLSSYVDGMAYDEATNKLYVRENVKSEDGGYQAIHVFALADTGATLDTTVPSTPTLSLVSASSTTASLSWTSSTDDSGLPVYYYVYRDDKVIAYQTGTTFTDSTYGYYVAPVKYTVRAVDVEGNYAESAALNVDNTNGGNAPLSIFIGGLPSVPAQHETSSLPLVIQSVAYSYTPTAKGGTSPYTWSATSLPTGLSINASTGEISGMVSVTGSYYTPVIIVHDSATPANYHYRRTKVTIRSSSYTDYDGDGVKSVSDGGSDADDTTINVAPGGPLQPSPTVLSVTGTTETSISLSWTAPSDRTLFTTISSATYLNFLGKMAYLVYHGTVLGTYPDSVFVGGATSYTWTGLSAGTHYFVVTAVDWYGLESTWSTGVQQTLGGGDLIAPTLTSVTIPTAGTSISLLFDEIVTRASETGWAITMTGGAVTMTYSSGSGTATLVYTLSRTVLQGEIGTVSWTAQANTIEDGSGNDLAILSLFGVANNSTQAPISGFNGQGYGSYYAEGLDESVSIVETADTGVILVGATYSYSWLTGPETEVGRVMMLKTDASGVESWRKVIGPEGYAITTKQISALHWLPRKVILSGTSPVIAGYRGTSGTEGINGFLMKFDSAGALTWDRSFNNSTRNDYFFDVVERTGGGFAICGQANDGNQTGIWLILTDSSGVQDPAQDTSFFYYLSKGWATGRAIRKTSDGGFIMAGYTTTGSALDEDYYVVKVASDGTPEWNQKYDNSGRRDMATSVEEDASGNFWIFGRSQLSGYENTKIWIVKTNSAGVLQTSYTIGDTDNAHAYVPRHSIKLASTNMLIIGYANVSSASGYHGYVTEIDTSGAIVGTPAIISPTTGYSESYLMSGVVSADTNYYLLAGTDNGSFSTAYDLWYLKMAVSDRSISNHTTCESKVTYYYDKDLDGMGNNSQWDTPTGAACFAMPGYVLNYSDPNDQSNIANVSIGTGSAITVGSGGSIVVQ